VITGNLVKRGEIPQQYVPSDAITDLASIRNDVAATDLVAGQILESDLFVSPTSRVAASATAQAIPKGDVAISVSVDAVHGVAGLIRPGDLVDILIQASPGVEQFLYQNVDVLAVGTSVAPSGVATAQSSTPTTTPPASGSGLLTLALPADAAARIALAQSGGVTGSLYLALVPPGSAASQMAPIDHSNLIPAALTPGG
jgi:pilus assembly protein CpaB